METNTYQTQQFFQTSVNNQTLLYIDVILYDSAPVISELDNEDNSTYTVKYTAAPFARVVRIVTCSVGGGFDNGNGIKFSVHVTAPSNAVPGFVEPVKVVEALTSANSLYRSITTEQFSSADSAGKYIYSRCIGKFASVVTRRGNNLIDVPRFSGVWQPFQITQLPNPFDPVTTPLRIKMLDGSIPFTPRIISGNAETDGQLLELIANILNGNFISAFGAFGNQDSAIDYQTPVPYYRPLLPPAP